MPDLRIETWAAVLVGYSTDVQPGETVAITGGVVAEPLLRAIARAVLARGARIGRGGVASPTVRTIAGIST